MIYTYHTIALAAGFILDLIFGDPRWLYHPVCLIGKLISSFEKGIRKVFPKTEKGELAGGLVEVILICVITLLVPAFVLYFLYIHLPAIGVLLETFWCYQLLATRSLRDESMKVYDALKKGTIEDARHAVSMIVGRDTAELTEEGVTKAAVETVAENTSDGVIAPMIYMAIGGVPLMFLYKGINTMDSMLGYKNDKYLYFGRCAAKLDDAANYLPSRISGMVMMLAAYFLNLDSKQAWKTFWRDRYNHLSPNSAMTESVAAGALNIQLGGGHFYFGKWVPKDTIGDDIRPVVAEDIVAVNNLLYMSAVISILFFALIYLLKIFIAA